MMLKNAMRWDIHMGYPEIPMTRTTLFQSNRSQAVRLPKEVAFPEGVKAVAILREGKRRVIVPADAVWDDFFDAPGVDLGERDQPATPVRDRF
jgi:antitoxin VapB